MANVRAENVCEELTVARMGEWGCGGRGGGVYERKKSVSAWQTVLKGHLKQRSSQKRKRREPPLSS